MRSPACSRQTKRNFYTQFHTIRESCFSASLKKRVSIVEVYGEMLNCKHFRRRIQLEDVEELPLFVPMTYLKRKLKVPFSLSFFNSYYVPVLTYATRVDTLILLPSFPLAHVKFWYITLQMIYNEKYKGYSDY